LFRSLRGADLAQRSSFPETQGLKSSTTDSGTQRIKSLALLGSRPLTQKTNNYRDYI